MVFFPFWHGSFRLQPYWIYYTAACTGIENSLCVHRLTLINLSFANSKLSILNQTNCKRKRCKGRKKKTENRFYACVSVHTFRRIFSTHNFNFKCFGKHYIFFCVSFNVLFEVCAFCSHGFCAKPHHFMFIRFICITFSMPMRCHVGCVCVCSFMAQLNLL